MSFEVTEILIHKFAHHPADGGDHGGDHGDGHGGEDDHGTGDAHGTDSHDVDTGHDSHGVLDDGHGLLGNVSDYLHDTVSEMVTHAISGEVDSHHSIHKSQQSS